MSLMTTATDLNLMRTLRLGIREYYQRVQNYVTGVDNYTYVA